MEITRRAAFVTAGGLATVGLVACSNTAPAPGAAGTPGAGPAGAAGAAGSGAASSGGAAPTPTTPGPGRSAVTIVGHRGACGYRPEHTVDSYSLAARFGADAVDVDLCSTRDGHLVARHEPEIGGTTDVAAHPEFASRRTTKVIDSLPTTGWFTVDFTLAELKTLRVVERIPATRPHNTLYNGRGEILTFDEVLHLLDDLSRELGRRVGILPEVKHSTFHRSIGLPIEPTMVDTLKRRNMQADPHVIIQSFETTNLKELKTQLGCPLLQLVDSTGVAPADLVAAGDRRTFDDLVTPAGLREVAGYATWIGPSKERVIVPTGGPTSLVTDAKAVGLKTMPYTFRNENEFLPPALQRGEQPGQPPQAAPKSTYGDAFAEYAQYRALGVEGLFSDNSDTAIAAFG
ncbi:glycerophosphodiester phosphodiesterase [Actinomycetospora endophytica]|uniref:glycerophosphodiester phosphodiesterase n=1 Tax=Actinomycetospora endophytica TaxID=2291215 RepID=A0ABS8P6A2_9PSEU|nr:glycerophosphodiester phosphodiesterase family protein [Actinomycetospora endophytica]MCD2192926.1 glycerophosphodiester phosphodiesterase [Actinomycetospora endophytica]